MKNANLFKKKPPREDLFLRLPGASSTNNKFGRCLKKIASFADASSRHLDNLPNQFRSIIEFISKKGNEFKFEFLPELEYFKLKKTSTMMEEIVHSLNTNLCVHINLAPATSSKKEIFVLNEKSTETDHTNEDLNEIMLIDEMISKRDPNSEKENLKKNSLKNKRTYGDIIKSYLIETTPEATTPNEIPTKSTNINEADDNSVKCQKQLINKHKNPVAEINEPDKEKSEISINGNNKCSKRLKIIDTEEISSDIFKLKKLTKYTYLVPYLVSSSILGMDKFTKSVPWFNSLDYLSEEAEKHNFLKCKAKATLVGYSLNACPQIGVVFVSCKKCNYINFAPFHAARIHRKATFNNAISDLDKSGKIIQLIIHEIIETHIFKFKN